jgi:hypothetical protein
MSKMKSDVRWRKSAKYDEERNYCYCKQASGRAYHWQHNYICGKDLGRRHCKSIEFHRSQKESFALGFIVAASNHCDCLI